VLLVISVVTFIAFFIQQAFSIFTTPEHRLLPIHYFKTRTLALMFFLSCAGAPPVIVPVYFISLFYQFAKGDTALDAAVKLLPFIFMTVLFSMLNGGIMGKEGHYAPWFMIASPLIIAGSALMYTVDEHSSSAMVSGYSALLGIGAGCLIQICFIVGQAIVPRAEMSSCEYLYLGRYCVTNTIQLYDNWLDGRELHFSQPRTKVYTGCLTQCRPQPDQGCYLWHRIGFHRFSQP
jgi:hypothetical protein